MKTFGEKSDVYENIIKEWKEKLLSLIQEYSPSDIYNADERGLFYDLQPDITFSYRNAKYFCRKRI